MTQIGYGGSDDTLVVPSGSTLGFYGKSPIAQGATIATVSTTTDFAVAINALIARLQAVGLIASS